MEPRILRFRHNRIDVASVESFETIKGSVNQDCKDVYFVRALGCSGSLAADILKMDQNMKRLEAEGKCYYSRIASLPRMSAVEDVEYYTGCHARWEESRGVAAAVKTLAGHADFAAVTGKALTDVLALFRRSGTSTVTMEKNFGVKLLFWLDAVLAEVLTQWDEKKTVKLVMENITKKQEYLFAYFLTLLGCDVMLLQTAGDLDAELKALDLSGAFLVGDFREMKLPLYNRDIVTAQSQANMQNRGYMQNNAASHTQVRQSDAQNIAVQPQNGQPSAAGQPIRVQIPPRAGRRSQASPAQTASGSQMPGAHPAGTQPSTASRPAGVQPLPSRPQPSRPAGNLLLPPTRSSVQQTAGERRELTYEELAQLAKSVVMIAIRDKKGDVIGTGSGIMVGRKGYILTNNHVASGGCFYSVRMEEEENTYDTDEVIKYNPVLDLAVIRIQRELQPLPVYKGKEPLVRGQKVVAIGSPLGFFNSVSDGIIAGFRSIDMVDMIQFTAPTSPGSSGGAVLNMYGEVIGISTAGMDNAQNINLAMGYECINSFIQGFLS